MTICGTIYLVTNRANGKKYVGKTIFCIQKRWVAHCRQAMSGKRLHALHRAIRKHGPSSFVLEILQHCQSEAELNEAEILWIARLNTKGGRVGYNMTSGGEGLRGFVISSKTRKLQSLAKKGRPQSAEHIRRNADARRGKTRSDDTKEKIRNALKGMKRRPETIELLRRIRTGMGHTSQSRAKLSRPVVAGGIRFASVGTAADALEISSDTVRRRIKAGLDGYKDITPPKSRARRTPAQIEKMKSYISIPVLADGQPYPSMEAAAASLKMTRPGIKYRIDTKRPGYALLAVR